MRFILLVFLLNPSVTCLSKQWKSIIPLKSTRADVERLLGPPHERLFLHTISPTK